MPPSPGAGLADRTCVGRKTKQSPEGVYSDGGLGFLRSPPVCVKPFVHRSAETTPFPGVLCVNKHRADGSSVTFVA